jgi:hypothetical protein
MMRARCLVSILISCVVLLPAVGQQIDAPVPQRASIHGTVTDVQDASIPGATVTLDGAVAGGHRTLTADGAGAFDITNVDPTVLYTLIVSANGFATWTSAPIALKPGQALGLDDIKLNISVVETTVAAVTIEQLARQQATAEEQQRVFGVIPNFYVVYDKHPVPLTTKLKYEIAFKAGTDIVSVLGDVALAGINQAADTPNYKQGWDGYGQRFGAAYADSFSNIMIGGAVLPSLLHQDPRYFYQGKGTGRSRAIHALSSPFICRGDNGHPQFNASSMGGDLIAGSLTNVYYPPSNRGPGIVFSSFLVNTGGRMANAIIQEFILGKYTTNAKP